MSKNVSKRAKRIRYIRSLVSAVVSIGLVTQPVSAVEPVEAANQVLGTEGGAKATKEALNAALKLAKTKPALTTATGIVCLACLPAAGGCASAGLCIACGILIAETLNIK